MFLCGIDYLMPLLTSCQSRKLITTNTQRETKQIDEESHILTK